MTLHLLRVCHPDPGFVPPCNTRIGCLILLLFTIWPHAAHDVLAAALDVDEYPAIKAWQERGLARPGVTRLMHSAVTGVMHRLLLAILEVLHST